MVTSGHQAYARAAPFIRRWKISPNPHQYFFAHVGPVLIWVAAIMGSGYRRRCCCGLAIYWNRRPLRRDPVGVRVVVEGKWHPAHSPTPNSRSSAWPSTNRDQLTSPSSLSDLSSPRAVKPVPASR